MIRFLKFFVKPYCLFKLMHRNDFMQQAFYAFFFFFCKNGELLKAVKIFLRVLNMFLILLPKQLVPDKYSSFMMIFFIFVIRVKIYVLNCRLASLFVLLVASKALDI